MDGYEGSTVSVTIKVPESKKYAGDNPWTVFKSGSPEALKKMIAEAYGLEHEGLLLSDVTINAQRAASGLGAVAHGLGGQVLSQGPGNASESASEAPSESTDDVWSQVSQEREKAEEEPKKDPILVAIEQSKTVDELKQLWAENQTKFNDNAEYMAAWKAKGKSLS